ncbi:hypothetical protein FM076_27720 [Streptomyces albus subsp. chlorinus]|uniref:hypothetical protein n=1 Tax=Streptomyces albus TaxID=1888 RepID=UPI0015704997|nr:hypothetical protein [Streptomyces albus]NSC24739.1 hypothetical protein [Streptomyces albus subsp. chlorinus]
MSVLPGRPRSRPRPRVRTRPRFGGALTLPSRARGHRAGVRYFHQVEDTLVRGSDTFGVPEDNEAGVIGWGTSWRMQGYLLMAERTGDPVYATRLAQLADRVLAARDDERGTVDHRGRSAPVWSTASKFTAATAALLDEEGEVALEVTVCPPRALDAVVTVRPEGDRFSLSVTGQGRPALSLTGLSLDPADERRADRALYAAHDQRTAVTGRLVRRGERHGERADGEPPAPGGVTSPSPAAPSAASPRRLRPGTYPVRPARVALAAQTGMIAYPIAGLVRLASKEPSRRRIVPSLVRDRLDGYLDAVVRAVAAHDHQWQDVPGGRGCYRWLPDEPVSFAGAELPTNEFLAMGRTLVHLAALTGETGYAERAAAMARCLRADLTRREGAAVWPYWPAFGRVFNGWTATGSPGTDGSLYRPSYTPVTAPEDVTHALIDLDFLHLYHRQPPGVVPPVLTDDDMRAVAATFARNVVDPTAAEGGSRGPRMRHDVSGAGRPGTDREQAHVAAWLPLRTFAAGLADLVLAVQPAAPPPPVMGVDTYCGALLARWG